MRFDSPDHRKKTENMTCWGHVGIKKIMLESKKSLKNSCWGHVGIMSGPFFFFNRPRRAKINAMTNHVGITFFSTKRDFLVMLGSCRGHIFYIGQVGPLQILCPVILESQRITKKNMICGSCWDHVGAIFLTSATSSHHTFYVKVRCNPEESHIRLDFGVMLGSCRGDACSQWSQCPDVRERTTHVLLPMVHEGL